MMIEIGDQVQCVENQWQGRVTGFTKHNGETMLICHHVVGNEIELDDRRDFDPRDVRILRKADPAISMRTIRVCFADPRYDYCTSINGTRADIARYFRGNRLAVDQYPSEKLATPRAIEFLDADLAVQHTVEF